MGTCYNPRRSYRWNYDHPPETPTVEVPRMPGEWSFLGKKLASPLGIAAGPLLNHRWIHAYARLGFDILTYKTVRTTARACYPLPNLLPVASQPLRGHEEIVDAARTMSGTWAVSFGMPCMAPEVWRRDVELAKAGLRADQMLVVSVVGTVREGMDIVGLAEDYAKCAAWAVEAGADAVEANFSCPNVSTTDGQLFQQYGEAAIVAESIRSRIGSTPLLLKIGFLQHSAEARSLIESTVRFVDGYVMTNSMATRVRLADGTLAFDGERRGICGRAIREASIDQVGRFAKELQSLGESAELVGVGGIESYDDVVGYLNAGATVVEMATAAMIDPLVGIKIRNAYTVANAT